MPQPPLIRRGASGVFSDRGLAGASHHAIIPNVNTADNLREIWPRLSADERRLFDVIARSYIAAVMPDFRYRQTTATVDVQGHLFKARDASRSNTDGVLPFQTGGQTRNGATMPNCCLPCVIASQRACATRRWRAKKPKAPPRYNEGTLIDAMQNAWRFVTDEDPSKEA